MATYAPAIIDVSAQVNYPATPQVVIPFANVKSIAICLEDDPGSLKGCVVSFDGIANAGFLLAGRPNAGVEWQNLSYREISFKQYGSGGGSTAIRVMIDGGT